jgi:pSer/pThr/pTyr-binding forkhead associated (FHA) protein
MSYLEIDGRRHPIPVGEVTIGYDPANQIALGRDVVQSKGATIRGLADGQVAIRKSDPEADIMVNGVRLGPQPTPLLHGDKIEIAGRELLFVDDRRSGSTSFIQAVNPEMMRAAAKPSGAKVATAGTGGRLVSLTDGREYTISGGSLLIGREAGCDVVIDSKSVSRRHAEIVATPKGYLLIDSSTNGTLLNGERIEGQRVLARTDVIRCGDYEFRFYADVVKDVGGEGGDGEKLAKPRMEAPEKSVTPASPPQPVTPVSAGAAESATPIRSPVPAGRIPTPPPGAEQQLAHTLHGIPAVPRPTPGAPRQPQPPKSAGSEASEPGSKRGGPLAALRGLRDKVRSGGAAKSKEPPKAAPPVGADQRLANTMHGIPVVKPPGHPAQPRGAQYQLQDTMHGIPTPVGPATESQQGQITFPRTGEKEAVAHEATEPKQPQREQLAAFVVRSGPRKGERMVVRLPVVNIGRADYNDIVLDDDSVSTVHAKLQRREGIWVLVDQESTNGTVVDGIRITEETVLAPGAIVRFGQVQTVFEPKDDSAEVQKGSATRVIQSIHMAPPADPRRRGPSRSDS